MSDTPSPAPAPVAPSYNIGAKEFIPSFIKRPPSAPPAAAVAVANPVAVPGTATGVAAPPLDAASPPPRPPTVVVPKYDVSAPTFTPAAARKAPPAPALPWKAPAPAEGSTAAGVATSEKVVPGFPDNVGAHPSSLQFDAKPFVPKFLSQPAPPPPVRPAPPVTSHAKVALTGKGPASKGPASTKPDAAKNHGGASSSGRPTPSTMMAPSTQQHRSAPGQPTATATAGPPPTTHTPTSPSGPNLSFEDTWRLFFIDRVSDTFDPYLVFEVTSVENFWRTFNNIPSPFLSPAGSSYFLFRSDVDPMWEHPRNRAGGSYSVTFKPHDPNSALDDVWMRLCCRCVGESWSRPELVTGVLVKCRERRIVVQVWTTERIDKFESEMLEAIVDVLPSTFIDWQSHEDAQKWSAENHPKPKPKRKG